MTLRIICIHREAVAAENPLFTIDHFHWTEDGTELTGELTRDELYDFLRRGGEVYLLDRNWNKLPLTTGVTMDGEGYVKTRGFEPHDDPLLHLPECKP